MIPHHVIIEVVCIYFRVTPAEFRNKAKQIQRLRDCRHNTVMLLKNLTPISVHQLADLLGYSLEGIRSITEKYQNKLPNQYNLLITKINQYEKERMYQSYFDNSDCVPALSEHDCLLVSDIYHQRVG